jgi:hypothetical protein
MRRMFSRSYFRLALPPLIGATFVSLLIGCEAVLGADFDDFRRGFDDPARDDGSTHDPDASPEGSADVGAASGGGGGASGTGAGAGGDKGGSTGNGGAAGSMSTVDAGGRSGASTDGASLPDVASDVTVTDDAAPPDAADGQAEADVASDLTMPPSDGAVGGGACTPNEVRSIATCGNCGLFLQVCSARGVWDPPFCRQEPGACAPGSIERRACPSGGVQVATCNTSCTWTSGDCVAPACTAGQTEVLPCALCGTQTRACVATDGGAAWGPFSACANQGVCAPGTRDVTTCGKCGTYSRVCNPMCAWDAWGTCAGEGECLAGSTETRICTIIPIVLFGKQTRSCDASCVWGAYDDCR